MISLSLEAISPVDAEKYLASNITTQRALQKKHVAYLADEMTSGRWKTNGDAIRFNRSGGLIDGQHRLMAIIDSGVTIKTMVARGIEDDAFLTIDTGRKVRGAGDFLHIDGEINCRNLAAALAIMLRIKAKAVHATSVFPVTTLVEALRENPEIRDSIIWGQKAAVRNVLRPAVAVSLHYLFSRVDKSAADSFFYTLDSGVPLSGLRDAPLALRETLFRLKLKNGKRAVVGKAYEIALAIKAWNAYRIDAVPGRFQFDPDREKSFPEIK